jgi:formylglycine-generating enzyme required for sulfatase activity
MEACSAYFTTCYDLSSSRSRRNSIIPWSSTQRSRLKWNGYLGVVDEERIREHERQRSEEEAKRKAEKETGRCIKEAENREEAEQHRPERQPSIRQPTLHQPEDRLNSGLVFRDKLEDGSQGPEMVVIPAGMFRMGDINSDGWGPLHTVWINIPFALSKYEVTFDDYDRFATETRRELPNDNGWGRGQRPVINVSWDDAVEYTKWLSA